MKNDLFAMLLQAIAREVVEELQSHNLINAFPKEDHLSTELLNTKQASEYYQVSVGTIRNWISKKEVESKRVGNRLYVIVESRKIGIDE